jgi:hypothetical protein
MNGLTKRRSKVKDFNNSTAVAAILSRITKYASLLGQLTEAKIFRTGVVYHHDMLPNFGAS